MAFTDSKIRALKTKERALFWEDGATGIGVRVSPTGSKTFVYMYRFGGKARMMTLGRYPKLSLANAHMKAAEAKTIIEKGYDPASQWIETKKIDRDAETLEDLTNIYLVQWARPHKKARSVKDDEDIIKRNILPGYGHIKARDLRKKDVYAIINRVGERGAKIQANRTLAVIRKMFNFAVEKDILETTPCSGIKPPFREHKRERVLAEAEILNFWAGLDASKMDDKTKIALKMMLLTAQRKGEVVRAKWTDIDLAEKTWTIQSTVAKNNILHLVPLSRHAITLLEELKPLSGTSEWLFPSPRKNLGHVGPTAIDHAVERNESVFGLPDFAPHDLRRTASTQMAKNKIPRETIARIINHVDRSVTAVYDRYAYLDEKRDALERWGRILEGIITGKGADVIPLIKPRGRKG